MLGNLYENQDCSAARALEIVGERWSLLILRDAMFRGFTRFSEFQRSLGIATNVLAKRLDSLVASGIFQESAPSGGGHREYRLTRKGLELMPVIIALTEWGDRWVGQGPVRFRESQGNEIVRLKLVSEDGSEVAAAQIKAVRI